MQSQLASRLDLKGGSGDKISHPGDPIRISIKQTGAPVVNNGYVYELGENIVALVIDMQTKYCEINYLFGGSDLSCGVARKASAIPIKKAIMSHSQGNFE